MAWSESAARVEQPDPHLMGTVEAGIYRRISSGPNLQRLMFHVGAEQDIIRKLVQNNLDSMHLGGLKGL